MEEAGTLHAHLTSSSEQRNSRETRSCLSLVRLNEELLWGQCAAIPYSEHVEHVLGSTRFL